MPDSERKAANRAKQDRQISDIADALMHASTAFASYQVDRCAQASASEMLQQYELSSDNLETVVEAIRDRNMLPIERPGENAPGAGNTGRPLSK